MPGATASVVCSCRRVQKRWFGSCVASQTRACCAVGEVVCVCTQGEVGSRGRLSWATRGLAMRAQVVGPAVVAQCCGPAADTVVRAVRAARLLHDQEGPFALTTVEGCAVVVDVGVSVRGRLRELHGAVRVRDPGRQRAR